MRAVLALAAGALVRREEPDSANTTFAERHGHEAYADPDITAKYDGWEQVLKILFTVGCRAKHQGDVEGEAKHSWNATEGHMDMDAYVDTMKGIQAENAADMKESCGHISAKGLPTCRLNCQDSWGDQMVPRDACDGKCEQKYRQFEAECYNKVESLKNVYNVELGKLNSYATCAELHCPDFPVTTGDNCSTTDLDDCKAEMVTDMQKDVTVDFCDALFEWIYESEGRDPATGDPIVFLDVGEKPADAEPEPDCECTKDHEHGPDCGCSGSGRKVLVRKEHDPEPALTPVVRTQGAGASFLAAWGP